MHKKKFSLKHLEYCIILYFEESNKPDYSVAKNEIFGDFKGVRNSGFYKRYLYNVKLALTFIKSYQTSENEYIENLVKRNIHHMIDFKLLKVVLIKRNNFVYSQTILLLRQIVA